MFGWQFGDRSGQSSMSSCNITLQLLDSYLNAYKTLCRICETDFVLNHNNWLLCLIVTHIQN